MKSYIILDRSGSMQTRWRETIGALKSYIEGLPKETKVYLLAFDNEQSWVLDGERGTDLISKFHKANIGPRGMTALFDAISVMGSKVHETAKKKAQIVILTDGQENASRETKKGAAGKVIDLWKKSNFDVVFIGADFDAFSEAQGVGVAGGQTISYDTKRADPSVAGQTLASRAVNYAQTGAVMDWSDEDRDTLAGKKKDD